MPANVTFKRLALLAEFASKVKLGRTAIMKLCFFLQESKGVNLGYHFSLYSYGPFDSDVLADIGTAVRLKVLNSGIVYYASGTGYEYSIGSDAESVRELAGQFLAENKVAINWVVQNLGAKTAGELELLSTILFAAKYNNPKNVPDLLAQVELIKPHFTPEHIQRGFQDLVAFGLLRKTAAGTQ